MTRKPKFHPDNVGITRPTERSAAPDVFYAVERLRILMLEDKPTLAAMTDFDVLEAQSLAHDIVAGLALERRRREGAH